MTSANTSIDDINDIEDDEDNIDEMYLTFVVEGSEYAIGLTHVIEIVVGQRILPVPDVPRFITGVINLRGKVVPVMDVRIRFGLAPQPFHERLCIVVVEVEGVLTGLVIDEVRDVLQMSAADIAPPVQHNGSGTGIIRGIGKRPDGITVILDIERLLDGHVVPENVAGRAANQRLATTITTVAGLDNDHPVGRERIPEGVQHEAG